MTEALTNVGFGVLNPMSRDFRGVEITPDIASDIVQGDKADIDKCELLFANCWKDSVGTSMEILYAYEDDIPIITVVPEGKPVSPWISYHSDLVVTSIEDGIEFALQIMKD